jgi:hypothetical protein
MGDVWDWMNEIKALDLPAKIVGHYFPGSTRCFIHVKQVHTDVSVDYQANPRNLKELADNQEKIYQILRHVSLQRNEKINLYEEGYDEFSFSQLFQFELIWAEFYKTGIMTDYMAQFIKQNMHRFDLVGNKSEPYYAEARKQFESLQGSLRPILQYTEAPNTISIHSFAKAVANDDIERIRNWPASAASRLSNDNFADVSFSENAKALAYAATFDGHGVEADQIRQKYVFDYREHETLILASKHNFPFVIYGFAHDFRNQIEVVNSMYGLSYSLLEIYPKI